MTTENFEPRIVGFLCNWCSYRAVDLTGSARIKYAPNVRIIRVMCSGRVDPSFVFKALAEGADGVMIAGCHPRRCYHAEQNHKAVRCYAMLKQALAALGFEARRLRLAWGAAAEDQRLAEEIDQLVADVRKLGPLNWAKNWAKDGERLEALRKIIHEHQEAKVVQR
jgi:F420-non-reducing hydrogenase iron-sulfur subunit